ncbi:MAG: MotA/TolQ/ExbB proton channel family protein [Candidatus Eutrophobiaceae bacterium]
MQNYQLLLLDALEAVDRFFQSGGSVLYLITGLVFVMWVLLLERCWYYPIAYQRYARELIAEWDRYDDHESWAARAIRRMLISQAHLKIHQNLALIKTLIALCPLFGLLGTVTGMIEVFSTLSFTGGADLKSMASGVSHATIPTMAGMVAALLGIFANIYVSQRAKRECGLIEESLSLENFKS